MKTFRAARMMKMLVTGLSVALLCAALPPPAAAAKRRKAEVWRRIRKLRMHYVMRTLGLEAETAAKLRRILRSFNKKRGKLWRKVRRARRQMRKLIKEHGAEAKGAQAAIDLIARTRLAIATLKHHEFRKIRKILDPSQQARYLRARRKFRRKIRKLLRRIRRKRKKSKK